MRRSMVVICLASCGGESAVTVDGAVVDAPGIDSVLVDARAIDAPDPVLPCEGTGPMGMVTLLGSPQHHGVFHDRDGAVLSQTAFDSQGMATGLIPPCGAVTFMKGRSTYFSVTHVMPGETITLRYPDRAPGVPRRVSVDFPAYPGATSFGIRPAVRGGSLGGCSSFGSNASPIALDFDDRCIGVDGTISFLAEARSTDGSLLAYADFEHLPLAASGTTNASVAAWRTEPRATSLTVGNLPAPGWTTTPRFATVLGGMYGSERTVGTSMGLPAAGTRVLASVQISHPMGGDAGFAELSMVVPADDADSLAFDAALDFAPIVSASARDDTDPARPFISWTTSRRPAAGEAIAITADWEQFQWFVIAPPDQPGALRFPDLPAELRPTTPPQGGPPAVTVASFSEFPTYADLRVDPLALWFPRLYSDPTDTFLARTSATGDYDLPNID